MTTPQFLGPGPFRDEELQVRLIRCNPADSAKGWVPSYDFGLFVEGVDALVDKLGYGVQPAYRGHHYAERAVRLLLSVWITCNPDNWPSRRTCERLGAAMVEIVPLPPENDMYLEGEREKCRYRLDL